MDEIYIRMCDCPEIQGQMITAEGQRFCCKPPLYSTPFSRGDLHPAWWGQDPPSNTEEEWRKQIERKGYIWLPRQEDIQGMMDLTPWEIHFYNFRFANKKFNDGTSIGMTMYYFPSSGSTKDKPGVALNGGSITELWLAFYMREVHNKTWDSKKKGWKDGTSNMPRLR